MPTAGYFHDAYVRAYVFERVWRSQSFMWKCLRSCVDDYTG